MLLIVLKATLLFVLTLGCLPFMRRSSATARHVVCACAMGGALLLPLTMLVPLEVSPVRLPAVAFLATSAGASGIASWPVSETLVTLWAAGMAVLLVRLAIGHRKLAIALHTATPAEDCVMSDVPVPLVAGLLRPVILMPRSADSWPRSQRAAALKHEQAHVNRHDLHTSLIAHLACAIYWFHPLAWAVARHQLHEQESACDDAVLCSGFEPASYAEALIATARQLAPNNPIGCHMTQTPLKSRIARLFDSGISRNSPSAILRATATVFALAVLSISLLNSNPRTYTMSDGVSPPRVLHIVNPDYSEEARRAKTHGQVLLRLVVDANGRARDIQVAKSLGKGLDEKAVEAVEKWTFAPGTKNGAPVSVRAGIAVNFNLR